MSEPMTTGSSGLSVGPHDAGPARAQLTGVHRDAVEPSERDYPWVTHRHPGDVLGRDGLLMSVST
jgi:hypothetical protein